MTPIAQLNDAARNIYTIAVFVFLQMDKKLKPRIDRKMFLGSFSIEHEGQIVTATDWCLGPGYVRNDDGSWHSQDEARLEAFEYIRDFVEARARLIPLAVFTGTNVMKNYFEERGRGIYTLTESIKTDLGEFFSTVATLKRLTRRG